MTKNPSCTIGGHALKTHSRYRSVLHEINDYLSLIDERRISYKYTRFEGTLRVINGLDYIPVFSWILELPRTTKTAEIPAFRRSQRTKTSSLKLREQLCTKTYSLPPTEKSPPTPPTTTDPNIVDNQVKSSCESTQASTKKFL